MIARDATVPLRCSGIFRGSELRSRFGLVWVWHLPEDSTGIRSRERQKKPRPIPTALLHPATFSAFQDQLFQLRADRIFARRHVPAYLQNIRFAANLAVFDVLLSHAGRRVHAGFIPFAASGTLKARGHDHQRWYQQKSGRHLTASHYILVRACH